MTAAVPQIAAETAPQTALQTSPDAAARSSPDSPAEEAGPGPLASRRWRALGVDVQVVVTAPAMLDRAVQLLTEHLDALDRACSRFREDSELVRLDDARGRPVEVSPMLAEAMAVALDAARQTDGDVDPTLGAQLDDLGYDRDFDAIRADGPAVKVTVTRPATWADVRLDHSTVRAPTLAVPVGVRLDLGATAKAWAADQASRLIAAQLSLGAPAVGVLVNLGGDVAVAGPAPALGWPVAVREKAGGASAVTIALTTGGVATSGTTARRWVRGGDWLHHVLDPRTGMPARTPWRSVTVAAGSCLAANVATTATIVRRQDGAAWLARTGLPARLVAQNGAVTVLGGWPEDPA